jgi:hypothetical protein
MNLERQFNCGVICALWRYSTNERRSYTHKRIIVRSYSEAEMIACKRKLFNDTTPTAECIIFLV